MKSYYNSVVDIVTKFCMMVEFAPAALIKMIHCNCSEGCDTLRCTCRKHGLECTSACGHCQDGNCDNMTNDPVIEDDDDDDDVLDEVLDEALYARL